MADTLELDCPGCDQTIQIDAGFIGGVCRCSHCGAVIAVDGKAGARQTTQRPDAPGQTGSTSGSDFDRISVVSARPESPAAASDSQQSFRSHSRSANRNRKSPLPMLLGIAGGATLLMLIAVVLILVLAGGGSDESESTTAGANPDPATPTRQAAATNPWDRQDQPAPEERTPNRQPTAPQAPDPATPPPGLALRAAWEFNGDAKDTAGGNKPMNGQLINGARINDGVLALDGEDDHVQVPIGPGLNRPGERLRIDIRFKAHEPGRPGSMQVLLESGGGDRGINFYLYNNRIYCGAYNRPGGRESGWEGSWLRSDDIRPNRWHVITLELEAHDTPTPNALTARLDGESIGSADGARVWNNIGWNGIGANRQNTRFHNGVSNKTSAFKGEIDFIRVYGD